MIDTITTLSCHRLPCHTAHDRQYQLINLYYFFQIVKEQKQPMVLKRPNLNPVVPAALRLGDGLRFGILVEVDGIEPTTPCLQSRCSPS